MFNWLTNKDLNLSYPRLMARDKALVTQSNLSSALSKQELANTCLYPGTNSWGWWLSAPPVPAFLSAPSIAGNTVAVLAPSSMAFPGALFRLACNLEANTELKKPHCLHNFQRLFLLRDYTHSTYAQPLSWGCLDRWVDILQFYQLFFFASKG